MAVVGWILLGILGLLLFILLLILLFPVSYRLEAEKTVEKLSVKARAAWLFGLFRIVFRYPEPGKPEICIAWASISLGEKEKKTGRAASAAPPESRSGAADQTEPSGERRETVSAEPSDKEEILGSGEKEEEKTGSEKERRKRSEKKKNDAGKPAGLYRKIRAEAEFYLGLWRREETKALASEMLSRFLKIFRNLFPGKIRGQLIFGAESPDITGYALAVYSIAGVYFPKRLSLELKPDFEKPILEGEMLIQGHVMLAVLLWNVLRIALDKRLHRLWREVSKHIS